MNTKLPIKISPCPILEAIVELRFDSEFEAGAVFGVIYQKVKDEYSHIDKLPILQLPENMRLSDLNLLHLPWYKLTKDNISLNIGPKIFSVSCAKEYIGWEQFALIVKEGFNIVLETGIVKNLTRLGMRYINFFEANIFDNTIVQISKNGESFPSIEKLLKVKVPYDQGCSTLLITNNAQIIDKETKEPKTGSIIDIDVVFEKGLEMFQGNMHDILEETHKEEKKRFFDLLKPEYLTTLNPEY